MPESSFRTTIRLPAEVPSSTPPCKLGAGITALLVPSRVAVVLETTVLDQPAGLDVTYGERAVATLEWIRAPEAVSGAEVAKQLGYKPSSDKGSHDDGETTGRLLRTVVVALAVLVVVAIGVLLGLRSYYTRRDRRNHVELLSELAN
jgi:hypothetical protein